MGILLRVPCKHFLNDLIEPVCIYLHELCFYFLVVML